MILVWFKVLTECIWSIWQLPWVFVSGLMILKSWPPSTKSKKRWLIWKRTSKKRDTPEGINKLISILYLLIEGSLMIIGLPIIIFKSKNSLKSLKAKYFCCLIILKKHFNHIKIQLLILYPYIEVPQTVHIKKSVSLSD